MSCLVDIGGGKDLAMVCMRGVEKMSIEDILEDIKVKASKMKKTDGGDQHKKQMKPFKLVPACIVGVMTELISFVVNKLGISIPAMKAEKHALGAAMLTSLGSLGFEDAIAPFTGFANCSMILSANAIAKQPVV